MSYQSFKRVLGETSLERKCRWWFGITLGVLLVLSFSWYSQRMATFVYQTDRKVGPELVRAWCVEAHSNVEWHFKNRQQQDSGDVLQPSPPPIDWQASGDAEQTGDEQEDLEQKFHESMLEAIRSFGSEFDAYVILPQDASINPKKLQPPQEPYEAEYLASLPLNLSQDTASQANDAEPSTEDPLELPELDYERVVLVGGRHKYRYYRPLYALQHCVDCHKAGLGKLLRPVLSDGDLMGVVRVEIDQEQTRNSVAFNNSLLWLTAVVIGMLSMLLLYFIVRYVIVKPVQHLRDVSNAVREGDVEQRAEIRTGDEFEELAAAFNRMLRRLLRQQDELQDINGELDEKIDQLAQANLQLFETNRVKSDFLATMSHELRTPLNSILGFSDVLSTIDALDDKQKRYVGNIQRSGKVLLEMINDILDLAKTESGKMEVRPTEFRVESVVAAQCDMARPLSERKNIDLVCECPDALPPMRQDQAKLQQVLNNLLSNAIKFTPEGGRIVVHVDRVVSLESADANGEPGSASQSSEHIKTPAMLRLTVQDTGVGISEDEQQLVFEKFRQGASAAGPGGGVMTREQSGAGLGLSIVRELCRLLGGDVSLDSTVGKGSTFIVHLPWTLSMAKNLDAELEKGVAELTQPAGI